jgi:hypothetical protein
MHVFWNFHGDFSLTPVGAEKPVKSSDNQTSCLVWE